MQAWVDNSVDILGSVTDFLTSTIGVRIVALVFYIAVCEVVRQLIRRRFRK